MKTSYLVGIAAAVIIIGGGAWWVWAAQAPAMHEDAMMPGAMPGEAMHDAMASTSDDTMMHDDVTVHAEASTSGEMMAH